MSDNLAAQYADSVMDEILTNDRNGTPYGVASDDNPADGLEDGEELSAMDYLADALDIQYIVDSERRYISGRVLVTYGGPTVWVNLLDRELVVTWGTDTERRNLPAAFVEGIDDALAEYWEAAQ